MRLLMAALALGLIAMVVWFSFKIEKPGPNVGELDALAILRLTEGQQSPPEYCARRGAVKDKDRFQKLANQYWSMAAGKRAVINRAFFGVAPERQKQQEQAQGFIAMLQKNRSLALSPAFRPQLVIISEFLQQQCQQLVPHLPRS